VTLGNAQRAFARDFTKLQVFILAQGYEFTYGDLYRDPRVHGQQGEKGSYSASKSAHKQKCAGDLNFFLNGKYLTDTEDYKFAGDYWKSLDPMNKWGGDFGATTNRPNLGADGNHFSRRHWGIS